MSKLQEYRNDDNFTDIMNDTIKLFEQTSCSEYMMSWEDISQQINVKYNNPRCIGELNRYLTRDYCVEKLCQIDTDYEIEIYGRGWENNNIVKPYFKGVVDYGEDISKIYNSATYGFCCAGYILMQRTLECALSGTTPLVLDVRGDKHDVYDKRIEDEIQFFHINKLEEVLKKEPKQIKSGVIQELFSYKHLANRILERVYGTLKN